MSAGPVASFSTASLCTVFLKEAVRACGQPIGAVGVAETTSRPALGPKDESADICHQAAQAGELIGCGSRYVARKFTLARSGYNTP